jgi:hypothetical protein
MFKALIAICVIQQFNVNGGAVCYLHRDATEFKSHFACMQNAEFMRSKMISDFVELNGNKAAIIGQAACTKEGTEASL